MKTINLGLWVLQRAHVARQAEWCPDPSQQPDLLFRGNELAGEVGEACNVIKKLERERLGWRGSRDTKEHLAEELADVIHCAILVAVTAGIDIDTATFAKFNATSEKNGLETTLKDWQVLEKTDWIAEAFKQRDKATQLEKDYAALNHEHERLLGKLAQLGASL